MIASRDIPADEECRKYGNPTGLQYGSSVPILKDNENPKWQQKHEATDYDVRDPEMSVYKEKYHSRNQLKCRFYANSQRCLNRVDAMKESKLMATMSPIDAAIGVARLSGFSFNLLDNRITATITKSGNKNKQSSQRHPSTNKTKLLPKTKQDKLAVNMADAVSSNA